jgi:hypothetical protein
MCSDIIAILLGEENLEKSWILLQQQSMEPCGILELYFSLALVKYLTVW